MTFEGENKEVNAVRLEEVWRWFVLFFYSGFWIVIYYLFMEHLVVLSCYIPRPVLAAGTQRSWSLLSKGPQEETGVAGNENRSVWCTLWWETDGGLWDRWDKVMAGGGVIGGGFSLGEQVRFCPLVSCLWFNVFISVSLPRNSQRGPRDPLSQGAMLPRWELSFYLFASLGFHFYSFYEVYKFSRGKAPTFLNLYQERKMEEGVLRGGRFRKVASWAQGDLSPALFSSCLGRFESMTWVVEFSTLILDLLGDPVAGLL